MISKRQKRDPYLWEALISILALIVAISLAILRYETDAHIQNEHSGRDEDNDWYGIQVGERMFDLCVWKDDDMEHEVCVVYECFLNDGGFWNTDTSKQWFLKERKIDD